MDRITEAIRESWAHNIIAHIHADTVAEYRRLVRELGGQADDSVEVVRDEHYDAWGTIDEWEVEDGDTPGEWRVQIYGPQPPIEDD